MKSWAAAILVMILVAFAPARAEPEGGAEHELPAVSTPALLKKAREAIAWRDYRTAVILFREAAERGSAAAQTELGLFYREGRGGLRQDDREAVRLVKRAADRGYAYAQFKLGAFYAVGLGGLPQDDRKAV